jgi:hypothetical protein
MRTKARIVRRIGGPNGDAGTEPSLHQHANGSFANGAQAYPLQQPQRPPLGNLAGQRMADPNENTSRQKLLDQIGQSLRLVVMQHMASVGNRRAGQLRNILLAAIDLDARLCRRPEPAPDIGLRCLDP